MGKQDTKFSNIILFILTFKCYPFFRFVLECRGDADPSPVYTWYRGGELLTHERRSELGVSLVSDNNNVNNNNNPVTNYTMMQISNEEHSQLEFPSPTNIQEGFYHCEARNDLGKDSL